MAGPSASRASRRPPYSGTPAASLRRKARRLGLAGLPAILVLGTLTGGCAVSGMFGIGKDDAMAKAETTGSIPATSGRLSSGLPPEADLVLARAAIAEVLSTRRKDFSTSWENPSTGARGTVTPIAAAYEQDGVTCHDFLASHLNGRAETWMRGEACQQPQGRWEVKVLRPWKRS
jgi:surface antigen